MLWGVESTLWTCVGTSPPLIRPICIEPDECYIRCDALYVILPLPFIEPMHCTESRLHPRADQPMHRNEAAPLSKTSSSTVLLCCCCQTLCRVVRCIIEVTRCNCRLANDWKQGRDRKSGGNQIGSFNLPNNHV